MRTDRLDNRSRRTIVAFHSLDTHRSNFGRLPCRLPKDRKERSAFASKIRRHPFLVKAGVDPFYPLRATTLPRKPTFDLIDLLVKRSSRSAGLGLPLYQCLQCVAWQVELSGATLCAGWGEECSVWRAQPRVRMG